MDILVQRMKIKFSKILIFITLIFFSLNAFSQNQMPDSINDSDIGEIHQLIDFYFQSFSEGDFEEFASIFSVPYYRYGIPIIESVDQIVDRYQGFRQNAFANNPNYQSTIAARVKVIPLWFEGVIAHVHWQRITTDNELIDEAGESFIIVKQENGWKIAGWLPLELREWDSAYDFRSSSALLENIQ